MLIQKYLEANGMWEVEEPPRAQPAPKDDQIRDLESRIEELKSQADAYEELRKQLEKERREQEQREKEQREKEAREKEAREKAKREAAEAAAAENPEPETPSDNP